MAKLTIRYFTIRPGKNGQARHFWQPNKALRAAGWKLTRLSDNVADALKEAQDINARVDEWRAGRVKNPSTLRAGSVAAMIEGYKRHRDYTALRPKTRHEYATYLNIIEQWAGDMPARAITKKMVQDLYETLADKRPAKAAHLIRTLRVLFSWGQRQSIVSENPGEKPKLRYKAPKGLIWTPEDVRAFVAAADALGYDGIGTAVSINEWLGQRLGDIRTVPMNQVAKGQIRFVQSKTGAEVDIPVDITETLHARILAQIARNKSRPVTSAALIQRPDGLPYTADLFNKTFAKIRDHAARAIEEGPERDRFAALVFRTLRHTAVTRLAEAGCTTEEIAAITGHRIATTEDIIDRYLVRTKKLARNAMQKRADKERATP